MGFEMLFLTILHFPPSPKNCNLLPSNSSLVKANKKGNSEVSSKWNLNHPKIETRAEIPPECIQTYTKEKEALIHLDSCTMVPIVVTEHI